MMRRKIATLIGLAAVSTAVTAGVVGAGPEPAAEDAFGVLANVDAGEGASSRSDAIMADMRGHGYRVESVGLLGQEVSDLKGDATYWIATTADSEVCLVIHLVASADDWIQASSCIPVKVAVDAGVPLTVATPTVSRQVSLLPDTLADIAASSPQLAAEAVVGTNLFVIGDATGQRWLTDGKVQIADGVDALVVPGLEE